MCLQIYTTALRLAINKDLRDSQREKYGANVSINVSINVTAKMIDQTTKFRNGKADVILYFGHRWLTTVIDSLSGRRYRATSITGGL